MGSLYLWGHCIQEMGGDVVIGRSIFGVGVIDGSLYSDSTVLYYINVCILYTHYTQCMSYTCIV